MSCTLTLCVLTALITAGTAIDCIICLNELGNPCSGNRTTCSPSEDVCLSSLIQYDIDTSNPESLTFLQANGFAKNQSTKRIFSRECGTSDRCGVIIVREPYKRTVINRKCCNTQLCTPEIPTAVPDGPQNMLTCPGCISVNSNWCEAKGNVQCRGSEDHCITYSSIGLTNKGVSYAGRGCATQSACSLDIAPGDSLVCTGGVNTSGCSQLHPTLLLTAATCLIMRLLY